MKKQKALQNKEELKPTKWCKREAADLVTAIQEIEAVEEKSMKVF